MTEKQPQQALPQAPEPGVPMPAPLPPERKGGFWRFLWRHPAGSFFSLLMLLFAIFIGQNWEATTIDFLFWEAITVPKILLLFLGAPIGALGWEVLRRAIR